MTDEQARDESAAAATDDSRPRRAVVVFVDRWDSPSVAEHVEAIAEAFPHWDIAVLQQFPPRRLGPRLRRKLRGIAADPAGEALQLVGRLWRKLTEPPLASSPVVPCPPPLDAPGRPNVTYRRFARLHGRDALDHVRSLEPWLGLSIGAPILKPALFRLPKLGTINIHKSLLPNYKGMPYGYWELHDGATESGVSIHWVDEGLDTGPVVARHPHPIAPYATIRGLMAELDVAGTEFFVDVLRRIDADPAAAPADPNVGSAAANGPPTRTAARRLYRALLRRRTLAPSTPAQFAKSVVKTGLIAAYVHVYAPARNLVLAALGRCRASILLYHRVNDGFLDNVTVGVEQFDRQMEMLSRRYDVIDMPRFLAERGRPRRRPAVVVTFDDGYRDNYLAAVLLRRRGLPYTFFVSTRIVGTDRAFPHDLKALGRALPTLDWDQIRNLNDRGFQIGNHTRHHADLGAVPLEEGIEEALGAREDLADRLGPVPGARWLAYPYGQRRNMNEDLRRRLPELGIDYCFSAYGGVNPVDFDPLDIRRQSVDHRFTLGRLRAAIEGWPA